MLDDTDAVSSTVWVCQYSLLGQFAQLLECKHQLLDCCAAQLTNAFSTLLLLLLLLWCCIELSYWQLALMGRIVAGF
jgi:hypothetical protein